MVETKKALEGIKERKHCGLTPIGLDARDLAKNILGKRGFSNTDLIAHWADVVGEKLATAVKPDKITYPKNERANGTLYVRVQGGAFATLLEHQKNIILDKVNTFLGYDALSNIKIQQDIQVELKKPSEPPKEKQLTEAQEKILQERIAGITDETLKKQLYEVGKKLFLK